MLKLDKWTKVEEVKDLLKDGESYLIKWNYFVFEAQVNKYKDELYFSCDWFDEIESADLTGVLIHNVPE